MFADSGLLHCRDSKNMQCNSALFMQKITVFVNMHELHFLRLGLSTTKLDWLQKKSKFDVDLCWRPRLKNAKIKCIAFSRRRFAKTACCH